jgi:hypothetical protein
MSTPTKIVLATIAASSLLSALIIFQTVLV